MGLFMGLSVCLLTALLLCAPQRAWAGEAELMDLVQDVRSASGYRYAARDDRGNPLDTLKIIDNPAGGFPVPPMPTGGAVRGAAAPLTFGPGSRMSSTTAGSTTVSEET